LYGYDWERGERDLLARGAASLLGVWLEVGAERGGGGGSVATREREAGDPLGGCEASPQ